MHGAGAGYLGHTLSSAGRTVSWNEAVMLQSHASAEGAAREGAAPTRRRPARERAVGPEGDGLSPWASPPESAHVDDQNVWLDDLLQRNKRELRDLRMRLPAREDGYEDDLDDEHGFQYDAGDMYAEGSDDEALFFDGAGPPRSPGTQQARVMGDAQAEAARLRATADQHLRQRDHLSSASARGGAERSASQQSSPPATSPRVSVRPRRKKAPATPDAARTPPPPAAAATAAAGSMDSGSDTAAQILVRAREAKATREREAVKAMAEAAAMAEAVAQDCAAALAASKASAEEERLLAQEERLASVAAAETAVVIEHAVTLQTAEAGFAIEMAEATRVRTELEVQLAKSQADAEAKQVKIDGLESRFAAEVEAHTAAGAEWEATLASVEAGNAALATEKLELGAATKIQTDYRQFRSAASSRLVMKAYRDRMRSLEDQMAARVQEAEARSAALEAQLASAKEAHATELNWKAAEMSQAAARASDLLAETQATYTAELGVVQAAHAVEIERMQQKARELADQKGKEASELVSRAAAARQAAHKVALAEASAAHRAELAEAKAGYKSELAIMQASHKVELAVTQASHKASICANAPTSILCFRACVGVMKMLPLPRRATTYDIQTHLNTPV